MGKSIQKKPTMHQHKTELGLHLYNQDQNCNKSNSIYATEIKLDQKAVRTVEHEIISFKS